MILKTAKISKKALLTGIFGALLLICTQSGNAQIDHKKLASQYYQNDAQWYLDNIPFFECSDKTIEEVYYYRWKLYKAHIRNVGEEYGYVITEFIDDVDWDKEPYGSINAASGFHIYEGRWLKDKQYVNGYIDYLYHGGGNDRKYSENIADATYACYLANADSRFVTAQLGNMQNVYNGWADHYDVTKKLYYIRPDNDATEYSVAALDASGGKDGWGGEAFRPTINSYMYGNALAISNIAGLSGDLVTAHLYRERAEDLKLNLPGSLWNDSLIHFTDRFRVNNEFVKFWDFIKDRELAGFVPWCYNLPENTPKYNAAWKHVTDTAQLLGKFGLRTTEPTYRYYMKQYRYGGDGNRPDCQWNGPSWPYQTSQVLTGMANLLNNYTQDVVTPSDYLKILRSYTRQHYLPNGELNLVEEYNPDTGNPIVDLKRSHHYLHSTYNDLIITGLCGIRPSEGNTLVISPVVDQSIRYFCLSDVAYHGHKLTIVYDADGSKYKLGKGITVLVDGKKARVTENQGKYKVAVGAPVVTDSPKPSNYALNILKKGYPAPSASVNSVPDSLNKAIDGRIWYFRESSIANRWSTWGSTSATDWYALDFGQPREISEVKLYLYADGKTYGIPDDYTVEFRNGDQWETVKIKKRNPAMPLGNTVNNSVFNKVVTNQIRINFKHGLKGLAIAVAEIECN